MDIEKKLKILGLMYSFFQNKDLIHATIYYYPFGNDCYKLRAKIIRSIHGEESFMKEIKEFLTSKEDIIFNKDMIGILDGENIEEIQQDCRSVEFNLTKEQRLRALIVKIDNRIYWSLEKNNIKRCKILGKRKNKLLKLI